MSQLGNLIKNGRDGVGITQVELAVRLGMTQQTISRWEAGKIFPPMEHLPALATAIEVPLDEMLAAAANSAVARSQVSPEPEPLRIEVVESRLDRIEALLSQIVAGQNGGAATKPERPLKAVPAPKPVRGRARRKQG